MTTLEPGFYELVTTKAGVDKISASSFHISATGRDERQQMFYWLRQWRRRGWYPKVRRIPDADFQRRVLCRHLDDEAYAQAVARASRFPRPTRMGEVFNGPR